MNPIRQQAVAHFHELAQRFFQQPDCRKIRVRDVVLHRDSFARDG